MLRLLLAMALLVLAGCSGDSAIRKALAVKTGEIQLSGGEVKLSAPLVIAGADNLTIIGQGTQLKVDFEGEAAIVECARLRAEIVRLRSGR